MEYTDPSATFVYNTTPSTRLLQSKSAIHPAVHYTPLDQSQQIIKIEYNPLTCTCEAVMNGFCDINYNSKTIKCCICGVICNLPPNYSKHISPDKLPYELMPKNTTFEVNVPVKQTHEYRYGYLFIIDHAIEEKQLNPIREQLCQVISALPQNSNIGLITYGKNVQVYEFGNRISTNYCINGSKEYPIGTVMDMLGIIYKGDKNEFGIGNSQVNKKFIAPLSEHRNSIVRRVSNIKTDKSIYVSERKHSCFGQALAIAIALSECSIHPTRIVCLVGNPCTVGPGKTISSDFKQQMRSPKELSNGENIKYFASSKNYYDSFIKRVINKKIILDMFIFSLNEIGFTEMSDLFINSGGFVVLQEEFNSRIFRESFHKIFQSIEQNQNKLLTVSEASINVYCSKDATINGALGQCYSLNKTKPFISDKTIGKGKTHSWYFGSLDANKTITIVYQCKEQQCKQKYFYIQFKTFYRNREGSFVTRVTTVRREWSNMMEQIVEGFDEEAAIVFLSRMCINKMLYEEQKNIRQWLDQSLVRWAQHYANYIKGDQSSFSLPAKMKRLPQLVFHLRRSHFVNRFGISLDQSFYKGSCLNRENMINCLSMIQPALLSYSLESQEEDYPPVAVQLDEEEMKDDVILLLDTYFVVSEWYGESINSWYQQKYHEQEGYENIAALLKSPKMDIEEIVKSRFPAPNYYLTYPGHSKERYLKSRVNPKKGGQQHQNMITDDSDLLGFSNHLIRVCVKQN